MVTFVGICDVLSGERRWYKDQKKRMTEDRPAMSHVEFLKRLQLPDETNAIAVVVRQAFADQTGLPETAIYPDDEVDIFMRMMSPWGDKLDITF